MKAIIALAALGAAGFAVYQVGFAKSPAVEAYESFADAVVQRQYDVIWDYAEGEHVKTAIHRINLPKYSPRWMNAFHGSSYKIESQTKTSQGVELVSLQTVSYTPAGTESAMGGTMASQFRHHVTVAETGGTWKVVRFVSEHVKTYETR
jgi:hypothetical protein